MRMRWKGANQTTHPAPQSSSIRLRGGHVSSYKRCKNLIPHRCISSELYLLVFSRGPTRLFAVCRSNSSSRVEVYHSARRCPRPATWEIRFGSKADICVAKGHVRFTPNSDRESEIPQKAMSALAPKTDMCGADTDVRFGPKADIQLCSLSHAHMRQKGGQSAVSGTFGRVRRRRKPIEIASMSSIMVCHIAHHPAPGK
jgi:hypothetical protein